MSVHSAILLNPYRANLFFAVLLAGLFYSINLMNGSNHSFLSLLIFKNEKPLLHPSSPSSTTGRATMEVEADPSYTLYPIFDLRTRL